MNNLIAVVVMIVVVTSTLMLGLQQQAQAIHIHHHIKNLKCCDLGVNEKFGIDCGPETCGLGVITGSSK